MQPTARPVSGAKARSAAAAALAGAGGGAAVQPERLSNPHFLHADLADEQEVTLGTA